MPRSISTAVTAGAGRQQPAGQDAEPRADLEHAAAGRRGRRGEDGLEHVHVDQEVLAEAALGAQPGLAKGAPDGGRVEADGGRRRHPGPVPAASASASRARA